MIRWQLTARRTNGEEVFIDLSDTENCSLKETDSVQFEVIVENKRFDKIGEPTILVGDVPVEMICAQHSDNCRVFKSFEPLGSHSSRYFYNFFGETGISLTFDRDESFNSLIKADILARADNAQLANEMLKYLTDRLDDAVSICFSRSRISGRLDDPESFSFTKLDIIKRSIVFISENIPLFVKKHKYNWKANLEISEQGQPTGPDSVYWVLQNLNLASPSSVDEANLTYNNRYYRLRTLPKEIIAPETDIFENRVIHTFLYFIRIFLNDLKENFSLKILSKGVNANDPEYARFDHTLEKFAKLALKHKIRQIDHLLFITDQLRRSFTKNMPSKVVPGIQPRITSYVAKHQHYLQVFRLIEQCNLAPSPNLKGDNILLGLKNLAIVYELTVLLMLNDAIKRCFDVKLITQSYRLHGGEYPFGGVGKERPTGEINNFFEYSSSLYDIELMYEPKIYPMSNASQVGDLVDTSCLKGRKETGPHYFCPDFTLKIKSKRWSKAAVIIFDAKYKHAENVKKYDIVKLTQNYLLNIHQVNEHGTLGISPIKLLLILFAHDRKGNHISTVKNKHLLTGKVPVLPQSAGILIKPGDVDRLDEYLKAFIGFMDQSELENH